MRVCKPVRILDQVKITCSVERTRRFYSNGLEVIELFVSTGSKHLPRPPKGQRVPVTLAVGGAAYTAGLRTYPPTGDVYLCRDLVDVQSGARTSLARVFDNSGVPTDKPITVHVEGDTWTVSAQGGVSGLIARRVDLTERFERVAIAIRDTDERLAVIQRDLPTGDEVAAQQGAV
jgi:hypothetical protein